MKVSAQYAQEHLEELFDAVDMGETVEFETPEGKVYRFTLTHTSSEPEASRLSILR